ncbi:MAG TPA: hypothetical protein VKA08_02745, partial [Balneolales bacterium]|nr:hypothetical protein [Balneolales bacterium]
RQAEPTPNTTNDKNYSTNGVVDSLGTDGAVAVIRRYYTAINNHTYRLAYKLWGDDGAASKQTFTSFKNGYLSTDTVEVIVGQPGRIEGAAGSRYIEIPVSLKAITKDGAVQHFAGQYVLRRTVVDGSTPEQRRWHLYSAHLSQADKQHP